LASFESVGDPTHYPLDPAACLQWQRVNPVEHLWDELREKYLHNRLFSSLELLMEELCRGLNALAEDHAQLTSMMSFPHLKVAL